MSITSFNQPRPATGAIANAHRALIAKLHALIPPNGFSINPYPNEFDAVMAYMRDIAEIGNELIAAVGHEVDQNSPGKVDMKQFLEPFSDGITGNALYEVEKQREMVVEEFTQLARAS